MARVTMHDPATFPAELRSRLDAAALDDPRSLGSLRGWAQRPELAAALLDLRQTVTAARRLPPRLVELVRLRIAFHNQCRSCMSRRSADALDGGMTEDDVCELRHPEESDVLDAAERAALRYADLVATAAPQEIDDELFARLRSHFDDGEIVELGMHVAIFLGFGRIAASWDLVDELPEPLTREGQVGPWDLAG